MTPATVAIVAAGVLISLNGANAQSVRATIMNGDVYLQGANGSKRLTQGGKNSAATMSRDGSLIAYVHDDGPPDMTSLYVCIVASGQCRRLVAPQEKSDPQLNLTNISNPRFSYQASVAGNGAPSGSIFFMAQGWATSGAIHRATLSSNSTVTFVTASNSLEVVSGGKFAGALDTIPFT